MADALADLHEEILLLLPANVLLNFRRVCKDWNALISSQRFVQRHLRRSGTLIVALRPPGITVCDDRKIRTTTIPFPPGFSARNTRIAGSCDGLVCLLRNNSMDFAIINPTTGKFDVRTKDGVVFNPIHWSYWFGRHPCTGEYLIIGIHPVQTMGLSQVILVQVYEISSTLQSSQVFAIAAAYPFHTKPILFRGALLWAGFAGTEHYRKRRAVVLAYDIEKKKVSENRTPIEYTSDVRLGISDGCLIAIVQGGWGWGWLMKFDLWIMREYGVEESWTKYDCIKGFPWLRHLYPRDSYPLGFLPGGDLVLHVSDGNGKIVKYSFDDEEGGVVVEDDSAGNRNIETVLCADSLVSSSVVFT